MHVTPQLCFDRVRRQKLPERVVWKWHEILREVRLRADKTKVPRRGLIRVSEVQGSTATPGAERVSLLLAAAHVRNQQRD